MGKRHDDDQAFKIEEEAGQPVGPGAAPLTSSFDPTVLDFGHYAGYTIKHIAEIDPNFLNWLERHPSGARYRGEIHRVLGSVPLSTDRRW